MPPGSRRPAPVQRFCGLRKSRETSALPQLPHFQVQSPQPGVQSAVAIAVAPGCALLGPFMARGANQAIHRSPSCHPSLSVIRCRTASLRLRAANPDNHAFAEARLAPWWSWSSRSPCGSWLRQAPSRPYRMAIPTLLEICRMNDVDPVALDGICCGAHRKSMAAC